MRDLREATWQERFQIGERIRLAYDVAIPDLEWFNTAPCPKHAADGGLSVTCQRCGLMLRRHQRIGAAWLYARPRGFLADSVGTGKTPQVAWLIAAMKETGELGPRNRALVICKASAVGQWHEQLRRMLPRITVSAATGTVRQRENIYIAPWEVMVVSDRTFTPKRGAQVQSEGDIAYLENFQIGLVVYDDIDAMRNARNRTAAAIRQFCRRSERVVGSHGTPAQKRIIEMHSQGEPIGMHEVLGSERVFRRLYVQEGTRYIYQIAKVCEDEHLNDAGQFRCQHREEDTGPLCGKRLMRDPQARKVRRKLVKDIGIKNAGQFRYLTAPYVLRRKAADITDAALPAMQRNIVWLDPTPRQRERYAELRRGMLRRIRQEGEEEITQTEAAAAFTRGQQICSGLATLDDGRDDSAKLDWTVDVLTGDLAEDKVVCFVYFKPNVRALADRLSRAGVEHVLFWGNEQGHEERRARLERFREDAACRVLVGTTSIEQSLNLQAARHLICVDTIMNPSRMEQLAGRIRRQGSAYNTIYVHLLWLHGTQEDGYQMVLEQESAAISSAWGETENDLWGEAMSPAQMARLVAGV